MSMLFILAAVLAFVCVFCLLFTRKNFRIQFEEPKYQMLKTEQRYDSQVKR